MTVSACSVRSPRHAYYGLAYYGCAYYGLACSVSAASRPACANLSLPTAQAIDVSEREVT